MQKSAAVVIDDDGVKAKAVAKVPRQRAAAKPKPEPETVVEISPDAKEEEDDKKSLANQKNACEKSMKKKVTTLTSVLTARSKAACGIKPIDDIDSADSENQLAVVDYVEDIYKFYRLSEVQLCFNSPSFLLIDRLPLD